MRQPTGPSLKKPHWKLLRIDKDLQAQVTKVMGDVFENENDRYRALIAHSLENIVTGYFYFTGSRDPEFASGSLTQPVVEMRLRRFADDLEWHVNGFDFEFAKKHRHLPQEWTAETPEWLARVKEHQEHFAQLMAYVDARAQGVMDKRQWLLAVSFRGYLRSNTSTRLLCSDNAEMLSLYLWRYGKTNDLVSLVNEGALLCSVERAVFEWKPSSLLADALRPAVSFYHARVCDSMESSLEMVERWLEQVSRDVPGVLHSKVRENLFKISVESAHRDNFFKSYESAAPHQHVSLFVDFESLKAQSPKNFIDW